MSVFHFIRSRPWANTTGTKRYIFVYEKAKVSTHAGSPLPGHEGVMPPSCPRRPLKSYNYFEATLIESYNYHHGHIAFNSIWVDPVGQDHVGNPSGAYLIQL